ncbi:proton-coupled amino acid transporter-like protein pathetic [Cephus cinctus]|uniref:Proton-coupled amino acid transporter-like protein pathetic n=1 Tax=Cephus cinctus TaxID=211228 RepID=A0AAJ7BN35_CEPCN|nr:proton-coupled amino acid transporter-like protein pathetic [Cephus cinctus]
MDDRLQREIKAVDANTKQSAIDVQDEDYDPFSNRSQDHLNSDFAVFIHLLKAAMGSGILFLPQAFMKTGYVVAIVSSILIGALCTHTAVITVQCSQILCKRERVPVLNFAETAGASFRSGPRKLQKYSIAFNVATNAIVCFVQYQTTVIYALYVATSFQQVIEHFSNYAMDSRIYILIFLPIYLGLALIPNLKYLVPISIIGSIFLGIGLFITVYYLFVDIPSPESLNVATNVLSLPVYCVIFLFAMHNMSILLPLENSMKNPKNMSKVLRASMALNTCIYATFGFLGYNKYNNTCDTVIKNLPLNEILAQVAKIAVSISVMFTYGLQYFIPIGILWPIIAVKIKPERQLIYEISFRLGGVFVSTFIAIAIPQMVPLLGLFTALTMTTAMLLIPITIELATKWEYTENRTLNFLIAKNIIIAIIWALLLIFGCIESIKDIIENYTGNKDNADICG